LITDAAVTKPGSILDEHVNNADTDDILNPFHASKNIHQQKKQNGYAEQYVIIISFTFLSPLAA